MVRCIVMFSGGLDSVVASHLLKSQGVEVCALHFVLPFDSGIGWEHSEVRRHAETLGVALRIEEEGEEFLSMMREPSFGYGKHVNPCIDCRIHRLRKAAGIMKEMGASFIATGEVVGQRPMSQRRDCMRTIEKRSGLEGLLLRPLSALLLEPTTPELQGLVDRSRLLALRGRGRKEQLRYAREHGLTHGTPGGGCILTEKETARRYLDLVEHMPDYKLRDFRLLAYGRRFRLGADSLLVIGRNHGENVIVEKLAQPGDLLLETAEIAGPLGLLIGDRDERMVALAGSILLRYSRARDCERAAVEAVTKAVRERYLLAPATDELCGSLRV